MLCRKITTSEEDWLERNEPRDRMASMVMWVRSDGGHSYIPVSGWRDVEANAFEMYLGGGINARRPKER